MPIGERFCLSFSLLRLTQKMEFSPRTIGLLFHSETLSESQAAGTERTVFQTCRSGGCFSLSTPVSAFCSQLTPLLHFAHSLLCKSPIWAIKTAIYTGFLLLRAQQAARSFHGTHSCGCLSGGGNPPPESGSLQGMPERTSGVTLGSQRSVHGVWIEEENAKGDSTGFDSLRVKKQPNLVGENTRVKTRLRDQTLLGRGQSSAYKDCSLSPCQVPDNGVVLFLTLRCNKNETRVLDLRFLVSLFWPQKHRPFDKVFWYSSPLSSFFPPE